MLHYRGLRGNTQTCRPLEVRPFKRITSPGNTPYGRLFVTVDWDGKRLSITGVEGPKSNGDCRGGCGQTGVAEVRLGTLCDGWTVGMLQRLSDTWDRWHLNDMRAACEHQRADSQNWDTKKSLELTSLTWGPMFHDERYKAKVGKLTLEEYAAYAERIKLVYPLSIEMNAPKHPDLWGDVGRELLDAGYLKVDKTETKAAGWVHYQEHPEGLLCKPCSECGHRYGSAWLHEDVPADVLDWLKGLPDAEGEMPAAWRH